jgi:lactate permease
MGSIEMKLDEIGARKIPPMLAWLPYLLLAGLLVLSRTVPEFRTMLQSVAWSVRGILGETGIHGGLQPLYLPGGILVFVCLVTVFLHNMK